MFTFAIIAINVAVFYFLNIQHPELISTYGLSPETLHSPYSWFTNVFVHGNIVHIGMNMLLFAQIGFILEQRIGSLNFLALYAISAVGGDIASYLYITTMHANVVVIGASGAIFGVFAYVALFTRNFQQFLYEAIGYHVIVFITHMPIAWYAHLGGAILGVLVFMFGLGRQSQSTSYDYD